IVGAGCVGGVGVVAGVGVAAVVGAGGGALSLLGALPVSVGAHAHGAVAGQRFAFALGVVVELPAEGAAGVFAEQAGERGLVLEGLPDGAGGGVLGGRHGRPGLADFHRLIAAAAGGGGVVVVAGVGGDPVVGAGGGDRVSIGPLTAAVGALSLHDVLPICFAFALGVVVELPAEGAAGVFAEQAGERGLVLEGLPDGAG